MVSRGAVVTAVVVVIGGCLGRQSVPCGDVLCPTALVCVEERGECAQAELVEPCAGKLTGDACTIAVGGATGTCDRGLCLLPTCGDGVVDPQAGETCDGALPAASCVDEGFDFGRTACAVDCTTGIAACGSLRPGLLRALPEGDLIYSTVGGLYRTLWRGATRAAYVSHRESDSRFTASVSSSGDTWADIVLPYTSAQSFGVFITGHDDELFVVGSRDIRVWTPAAGWAAVPVPSVSGSIVAAVADAATPLHVVVQDASTNHMFRRDTGEPSGWRALGTQPAISTNLTPPAIYQGKVYWPNGELWELDSDSVQANSLGISGGIVRVAAYGDRFYALGGGALWEVDPAGVRQLAGGTFNDFVQMCGDRLDLTRLATLQRVRYTGTAWAPLPVFGAAACNTSGALLVASDDLTEVRAYDAGIWASPLPPAIGSPRRLGITPGGFLIAYGTSAAVLLRSGWETIPGSANAVAMAVGSDGRLYLAGGDVRAVVNPEIGAAASGSGPLFTGSSMDGIWAVDDGIVAHSVSDFAISSAYPVASGTFSQLLLPADYPGHDLVDAAGPLAGMVIAMRGMIGGQTGIAVYEKVGTAWVPVATRHGTQGRVLAIGDQRWAALPEKIYRWTAGQPQTVEEIDIPLRPRWIGGTSPDDLVVVGQPSTGFEVALRWDGVAWSPLRVPTIDANLQSGVITRDRIILGGSTTYWLERNPNAWGL